LRIYSAAVFEILVFFLSVSLLLAVLGFQSLWQARCRRRRAQWLEAHLANLDNVDSAIVEFGAPSEVIVGTGQALYLWKSPAAAPSGPGLLIVNLVTDQAGHVKRASWETRGV
jgi:hypothetical protein